MAFSSPSLLIEEIQRQKALEPTALDWERAVNEFLPDMALRRDAIKRRAEELARERVR